MSGYIVKPIKKGKCPYCNHTGSVQVNLNDDLPLLMCNKCKKTYWGKN